MAFGMRRMVALFVLVAIVTAFVTYMALNVPIRVTPIPRTLAFRHLPAVLDAIALIITVDVVTILAMARRRRKGLPG